MKKKGLYGMTVSSGTILPFPFYLPVHIHYPAVSYLLDRICESSFFTMWEGPIICLSQTLLFITISFNFIGNSYKL